MYNQTVKQVKNMATISDQKVMYLITLQIVLPHGKGGMKMSYKLQQPFYNMKVCLISWVALV